MIAVIVLRIGAALVATFGFTPGAPIAAGVIFRVDQEPATPVVFK